MSAPYEVVQRAEKMLKRRIPLWSSSRRCATPEPRRGSCPRRDPDGIDPVLQTEVIQRAAYQALHFTACRPRT